MMLRHPARRAFSSTRHTRMPLSLPPPANTVVNFVPQQQAWIIERFGRFSKTLQPGLQVLVPLIDQIKYVQSLKEVAVPIPQQSAITQDNVSLDLDGVLYVRVVDPFKASYGIEDADYAVTQLAQTTMRAEIGQMTLDRTLAERQQLNANIVEAINSAAVEWGIECLRYEIRDIHLPPQVLAAMHSQVSAERQKRADILASEGRRQAEMNVAEGESKAITLRAEAERARVVAEAQGQAEAIELQARAQAAAVLKVADALSAKPHSSDALKVQVAEKYIEAFGQLAQKSTTVLLPGQVGDINGMVASAMSVYDALKRVGPVVTEPPQQAQGSHPTPNAAQQKQKDMNFPLQ